MQNNLKDQLGQLMQKDMDRRDFLKHVGVGFAGILGISAALKTLSSLNVPSGQTDGSYGANAYGGQPTASAVRGQGRD